MSLTFNVFKIQIYETSFCSCFIHKIIIDFYFTRFPVDLSRFEDYSQVIDVPMDLSTIREELAAGAYASPLDFAKDVRLVFQNSKNYNTNNKSRVSI